MAKLLDFASGAVVDVPDEHVTQAVASGAFGLPKGQVTVRDRDGKAFALDADAARQAFIAGDFRFESGAERAEREKQAKFSGTGQQVKTAAEATLRGVSFGLSDAAISGLGIATPEDMAARRDVNPDLATGFELGGAVLPALVPGGQFTAAGAAARAALATERAVAGVAGRGIARTVAAKATGGAAETGLYGFGNAISESVLTDTELTAQKLLAGVGMGFVTGGGAGGTLGLAGGALGRLTRRPSKAAAGAPEGPLTRALRAGDDAPPPPDAGPNVSPPPGVAAPELTPAEEMGGIMAGALRDPEGTAKRADKALEDALTQNAGVIGRVFNALGMEFPSAEGWLLRGIDIKKKQVGLMHDKGLIASAPRALLSDGRFASVRTPDDIKRLIDVKKSEAISEMTQSVHVLDGHAAPGIRPNWIDVADQVEELAKDMGQHTGLNDGLVKTLRKEAARIRSRPENSFQGGLELLRAYDPHLKWDSLTPGPTKEALRDVRRIINRELEGRAEALAITHNDLGIFDKWKDAKRLYSEMAELEGIVQDRLVNAKLANRFFSLTDNLAAGTGGVIGATVGGALGGFALAAGVGLAKAMGNKWMRERAPLVMARALYRLRTEPATGYAARALQRLVKDIPVEARTASPSLGPTTGGLLPEGRPPGAPALPPGAPPMLPGGPGLPQLTAGANSHPLGRFASALAAASARSLEDLWATHVALAETAPEYLEALSAAGFEQETDEQSSAALERAGQLDELERAAAEQDRRLDVSVSRFLGTQGGAAPKRRGPPPEGRRERFERATKLLDMLSRDPRAAIEALTPGEVADVAPATAAAMSATAARAVQFLHSKLPKNPKLEPIAALAQPWQPTDTELQRWERYATAIAEPHSVVEALRTGHVTPESVEALQAVYPRLLEDIRRRMMERLSAYEGRLSYSQRAAVSALMGTPAGGAGDPALLSLAQQAHASAAAAERQKKAASSARVSQGMQTEAQRIEGRGQ